MKSSALGMLNTGRFSAKPMNRQEEIPEFCGVHPSDVRACM